MQFAGLKKIYLSLSVILLFVLHFPLVFANNLKSTATGAEIHATNNATPHSTGNDLAGKTSVLYDSLNLDGLGLAKQAFNYAMKGFNYLRQAGKLANDNIISIVDLSMPSTKKRLFVIDLDKMEVVFNTYVAHGLNSGQVMAKSFSNQPESYKSSLGFYTTLDTYIGDHGYSLRLDGLEKGFNDNANRRDIVIHGAPYVNEALIKTQGYIGRSWGCPALPEKLFTPIINTIKGGTCLFIYGADKSYLRKSKIINS